MNVRKRGLLSLALAAFLSLNYIFPVSAEEKPAAEETTADVSSTVQTDSNETETPAQEPPAETNSSQQNTDDPEPVSPAPETDADEIQSQPSELSEQDSAQQPKLNEAEPVNDQQSSSYPVNYQVRNPNQSAFSDMGTIESDANTPVSELNQPSSSILPESKTENGIVYKLTDWYSDPGLSVKAETALSGPMTLYAAYQPAATVFIREPNQTDFTQAKQSYLPPGSPASDAIPDSIPITKTENGQLYVLSGWYEDAAMSRRSELEPITNGASYYAAYVAAAELELQTLVNAPEGDPIWNKNFSFTLTAAGTGSVVIRPVNSSANTPATDRLTTSITGQSSSRFYVTAGASVTASEADYGGIAEYGTSTGKFSISDPGTRILTAGPKTVPADSTGNNAVVFRFLNSKSPYVPRTRIYTYGKLPDNTWVGLGFAQGRGPKLPDSRETEPSSIAPSDLTSSYSMRVIRT